MPLHTSKRATARLGALAGGVTSGSVSHKRGALLSVCLASFVLLVDITIVQVALPTIQRDLHASLTGLQWVIDAYAVTLAAVLLTAGILADRYGRRLAFVIGVAIFALASNCAPSRTAQSS